MNDLGRVSATAARLLADGHARRRSDSLRRVPDVEHVGDGQRSIAEARGQRRGRPDRQLGIVRKIRSAGSKSRTGAVQ
jgi:hypothetical protein